MNKAEFIKNYKAQFTKNKVFQLKFEMGGSIKIKIKRVAQVLNRFEEVSNTIFLNEEIWVLLIIWDAKKSSISKLFSEEFTTNNPKKYYKGEINDGLIETNNFDQGAFDEAEIFYLQYSQYSFDKVIKLVYSSAGFDLAIENTIGITAHYVSFKREPILLNIYDDRGMELLSPDKNIVDSIGEKFSQYLL